MDVQISQNKYPSPNAPAYFSWVGVVGSGKGKGRKKYLKCAWSTQNYAIFYAEIVKLGLF